MSISQLLFDAIKTLEAEVQQRSEYGELLRQEILALIQHMKDVQQKLDAEPTEIESGETLSEF